MTVPGDERDHVVFEGDEIVRLHWPLFSQIAGVGCIGGS